MFNHKLPTDFPMQTLRKKTSPCKYKNEPGRFLGEGVSFRAKLIGVLEVPEARGDRMCQEALADLKMAIRAAGEHKQRIQVHVAIDGLRLRDDKTGDSLYHHPVHKISFIAQDMTDSRAFGYIFGSPDTGHRFFGIKTDKAASQVVIAMRDLFQVVFELKKKEIELAKQQLEGKTIAAAMSRHNASTSSDVAKSKNVPSIVESGTLSKGAGEARAEGGVAELVDLEQELSSLRRGLTLVEGLTPSTDPFGDSFIVPPQQTGLLPPPPSGSSSRGRSTPAAAPSIPPASVPRAPYSPGKTALSFDLAPVSADRPDTPHAAPAAPTVPTAPTASATLVDNVSESSLTLYGGASATASLSYDVFTELDPLGTGRSKPYVDKKLFFQELKNPPKKVLKDLVPFTTGSSLLSDILPSVTTTVETVKGGETYSATTITSVPRQSGGSMSIVKPPSSVFGGTLYSMDPFAETDPFHSADPFSDTFKEDPFVTSLQEFPKPNVLRSDEFKNKLNRDYGDKVEEKVAIEADNKKIVFNGPLQVSLPPEPAPKSPRLHRQSQPSSRNSSVRQRPQAGGMESTSPPPPLPPKKTGEPPPPRPPHDYDHDSGAEAGPPLPKPKRRPDTTSLRAAPRQYSSEEEYLTPVPPPLPGGRRFDITLSQLLTCGLGELAARLRVPPATLASMTLPQLTAYLRSYLAADTERANIHIEPAKEAEKEKIPDSKPILTKDKIEFNPHFEDDFAPTNDPNGSFVANFDDFDKKANPSYDRYAAFREMQEQERDSNHPSILDPLNDNEKQNGDSEVNHDSDEKEDSPVNNFVHIKLEHNEADKERDSHSPLKSLDELTLDSFNMFRNSVSPKPSHIDAKIEDIKTVMKNLQLEQCRRSVSPRSDGSLVAESKREDKASDRYAALREITITEPQDEFESLPSEPPKERKRSDEKSDGFDNSDFFDCIDNSSLSFSHVEDAFRKSPVVKEKVETDIPKLEKKKEFLQPAVTECVREVQPPARLSTGSMSEIASGSSPDTKDKSVSRRSGGGRWSVLATHWSSDSKDSESAPGRGSPPRPRRRTREHHDRSRQTSSSSRDVSPWEEQPPPVRHHRTHHRESRHNSSGSRECLDSGSGRDKDKIRDKRDMRERDRDSRDSGSNRDRRDSGSGRDRAKDISKERDHRDVRERRDRRSRDRDKEVWDRDYSRERDYRDSRSRERLSKDYREKDRDRHRKPHHSWDDEEDYSDGCGSGRSSPRDRWVDHRWRREERNYGSLGWRETRRRAELRQSDDSSDRRYGATLSWVSRRGAPGGVGGARREEGERRRARREGGERGRHARAPPHVSPFDTDFLDTPPLPPPAHPASAAKKHSPYASLEGTRFAFEPEEISASPVSGVGGRARDGGDSPAPRFRFDSDSLSPRSMFEDDFTSSPRARAASIAEEEEEERGEAPRPPPPPSHPHPIRSRNHRDINKSESVNIFVRENDPFEGDDFFACTGSDRAARRDNWPGDFHAFDNV